MPAMIKREDMRLVYSFGKVFLESAKGLQVPFSERTTLKKLERFLKMMEDNNIVVDKTFEDIAYMYLVLLLDDETCKMYEMPTDIRQRLRNAIKALCMVGNVDYNKLVKQIQADRKMMNGD